MSLLATNTVSHIVQGLRYEDDTETIDLSKFVQQIKLGTFTSGVQSGGDGVLNGRNQNFIPDQGPNKPDKQDVSMIVGIADQNEFLTYVKKINGKANSKFVFTLSKGHDTTNLVGKVSYTPSIESTITFDDVNPFVITFSYSEDSYI